MLTLLFSGVSPITAASAALSTQSICFDGQQSIEFATTAIGAGDFTAELWVRPSNNAAGYETFLDLGYTRGGAFLGYKGAPSNDQIMFYGAGVDIASSTGDVPINKWTHVAVVRLTGQLKMYIDGNQVRVGANSVNFTATQIKVGAPFDSSIKPYKGCMTSVRVVKSAVYSANFTPADVGSFSALPNAITPLIELTADNGALVHSSQTAPTVSGTLTYQSLVQSQSALTISSTSATYGSALSLTTAGGSGSGATSFVVNSGPCTVSGSTLTPTASGTCYVTATKAAQGNYTSASSSSTAITISKATPTFSNFANVSKTYGDSSFNLATPTSSTPGTWTYSSATQSVVSLTGISATVVGNGTSLVTATFTPTDSVNYVSGGTTSMAVTVGKPTLSVTASSHTVSYGGAIPTITPTYSGFVNGEDASVVSGTTCSTTYTTTTGVGTISSSCTGATASNYLFTYPDGAITVIQSGQTAALTISSTSVTYGSNLSLATTGGSGSGANSFVVDSGPCTVSGSTLTPTAAGTCYVTATKAANGNYLAASTLSTAIAIGRKGLTISGLSGENKEFDGGRVGSATGTPALVGIANSDDVLLGGTPTFTYSSSNVASGITVAASNYTLTGTTAGNYLLTQPTVTANITAKAIRVLANNVTVAFGAPVIGSVTAIGLVSPDSISTASYTYTPPGTSAVPTAVGVYAVEPSNAIFGTGLIANYLVTYEAATVTILAKYTVTYNGNGGMVASTSTSNVDFVVGSAALTLPTSTREGFSFLGWFTTETGSTQVVGDYTPTATATLWAHWIQKSLVGIGNSQKIGTITTLANVSNTYSATSLNGSVEVTYVANALAASTVIDIYQMTDSSRASSLISSANTYVLSLVIAWLTPTGTVPVLSSSDALTMLIRDGAIKKGAKVYSLVGNSSTLLGIATVDGSVTVKITEDPEVYIAISKPDAPTGVSATSGGNASSMVSWTAPSEGGSAITLFTAISNAGQSCTSATTSCLVTGLTNGTPYTFTVTATNTIGVSDASASSAAATPAAPIENISSTGAVDDSAASAAAQAKIEADKKAAEEAALAAKATKPAVTFYFVSTTLKLNAYNFAYLQKYVKSLKNSASVTCIGYSYSKKTTLTKANSLAKRQATAVCSLMKKTNKTLKTSIVVYPETKAPKAAVGAKRVGAGYRVDGVRSK